MRAYATNLSSSGDLFPIFLNKMFFFVLGRVNKLDYCFCLSAIY